MGQVHPATRRLSALVASFLTIVVVVAPHQAPAAAAEPPDVLAGDFIVRLVPGQATDQGERTLARLGLEAVRRVPRLAFVRVRPRPGASVREDRLVASPEVASVHRVAHFRAAAVPSPNDPNFRYQWNLPLIQVPDAWAVSKGAGATVAVLDTGVAYEDFDRYRQAPDLRGTTFVPGYDFVDGDEHPNDDIDPAAPTRPAHGTHVTGVIAQTTDNGASEAGVAPGAAIMPVRVLDRGGVGADDQIAAGIIFAVDRGAHVINMSFDTYTEAPMTRAAVAYAASKGVTMVAAVGNAGSSPIGYPARHPEVLAVGAVRYDRTRAYYSSFGPELADVDFVAPGGDLRVDQNADSFGDGILQQSMVSTTTGFSDQYVDGTSAAAPHVSGVAALLIGSGLATTSTQVRRALEASAIDLGPPGRDIEYGAGLVQAAAALSAAAAEAVDLAVTLEDAPDPVPVGRPITYTASVRNAGPAAATGVTATDALPGGFTLGSASATQGGCASAGTTVTCNLGALGPGDRATITVTATPGSPGTVTNGVEVRADQWEVDRADNHAVTSTTVMGAREEAAPAGYWLAASDGGIFSFGDAGFLGSTGDLRLNRPVVAMAATPSGAGYWLVASDGGIFSFGDAGFLGSTGDIRLNSPIVAMAPTPSGRGYWLVAGDGGIFSFGDATFLGSAGGLRLNKPIVGMAATPSGAGYWLVASDGGIFGFGDAGFLGSTGDIRLNSPIVAMTRTPTGAGYWMVAADGGIFSFGDAAFLGSTGALRLNQPIAGMAATPSGAGYWLVASDGGIFSFGDAAFLGSTGALRLNQPIAGLAPRPRPGGR